MRTISTHSWLINKVNFKHVLFKLKWEIYHRDGNLGERMDYRTLCISNCSSQSWGITEDYARDWRLLDQREHRHSASNHTAEIVEIFIWLIIYLELCECWKCVLRERKYVSFELIKPENLVIKNEFRISLTQDTNSCKEEQPNDNF